jgi:hypothetical protein
MIATGDKISLRLRIIPAKKDLIHIEILWPLGQRVSLEELVHLSHKRTRTMDISNNLDPDQMDLVNHTPSSISYRIQMNFILNPLRRVALEGIVPILSQIYRIALLVGRMSTWRPIDEGWVWVEEILLGRVLMVLVISLTILAGNILHHWRCRVAMIELLAVVLVVIDNTRTLTFPIPMGVVYQSMLDHLESGCKVCLALAQAKGYILVVAEWETTTIASSNLNLGTINLAKVCKLISSNTFNKCILEHLLVMEAMEAVVTRYTKPNSK